MPLLSSYCKFIHGTPGLILTSSTVRRSTPASSLSMSLLNHLPSPAHPGRSNTRPAPTMISLATSYETRSFAARNRIATTKPLGDRPICAGISIRGMRATEQNTIVLFQAAQGALILQGIKLRALGQGKTSVKSIFGMCTRMRRM